MCGYNLAMERRSFLSRFGTVSAALGVGTSPLLAAQASDRPAARYAQDDWFDQIPGKHRLFFDTTTARGVADALHFADNFIVGNKQSYGLEDKDLAIVVCLRHQATPFGFGDPVWAKYGKPISDRTSFVDPKTKQPPTVNVNASAFANLAKHGVHFAICDMASHGYARTVADAVDGDPEAIYKEFRANAQPNSHFVSAGIIAVNRAQERGYSLCTIV